MNPLVRAFSWRKLVLCCLALVSLPFASMAHNSSKGISAINFKLLPTGVEGQLAFSFVDADILYRLDKNGDESISGDEIAATLEQLKEFPLKELETAVDGFTATPTQITSSLQESNFEVHWLYTNPPTSSIKMRVPVLKRLTPEHQQFVTVVNATNAVLSDRILTPEQIQFDYTFAAPSEAPAQSATGKTFLSFLLKGIDHILFDRNAPLKITDHLLFLLALLVICDSFRDVVKIITSFTVAHSLTLALATLKIVPAPARIIEPLIAATIIYVGLENLFKLKTLKWRWIVTFVFGLIHGFGFAGMLQGMIGAGSIIVPLVSFNLGVEVGQVLVAALALPLFWYIKKVPQLGPRWVPICSSFVVAVGSWWLVQRIWF